MLLFRGGRDPFSFQCNNPWEDIAGSFHRRKILTLQAFHLLSFVVKHVTGKMSSILYIGADSEDGQSIKDFGASPCFDSSILSLNGLNPSSPKSRSPQSLITRRVHVSTCGNPLLATEHGSRSPSFRPSASDFVLKLE